MAYCRWSSMNWACDIYAYQDASGGWTIHVAGRHRIGVENLPPELKLNEKNAKSGAWVKRHKEILDQLEKLEFEDFDLPHAGETFNEPTLEAFKARMLELRAIGYKFPDYVLDDIDQEIKERDEK